MLQQRALTARLPPPVMFKTTMSSHMKLLRWMSPSDMLAAYPVSGMSTDSTLPLDRVRSWSLLDSFPFGVARSGCP